MHHKLILGCCLGALIPFANAAATVRFDTAKGVDANGDADAEEFIFRAGRFACSLSRDGNGRCFGERGETWRFALPTDHGAIESVYVAASEDATLVAYGVANAEVAWATLAALNAPSAQPQWVTSIPAMNMDAPLLAGGAVVIGAMAYAASFSVDDGATSWQRRLPYDGSGNVVAELQIDGEVVRLVNRDPSTGYAEAWCFDLHSGAVLEACGVATPREVNAGEVDSAASQDPCRLKPECVPARSG